MKSLTEDEVKALMRTDEYQNKYNPKFEETIKIVQQAWENLYPEDDRNSNQNNYYVWKAVGDSKTRSSHSERDGQVFCWDNPPEGGHPSEDYNCRCKAVAYEPPKDKQNEAGLVDKLEYASAGAMQGLSFGFADEIEGAMGGIGYGLASLNPKWNKTGESFTEAVKRGYVKNRDKRRDHVKEGYEKAPVITQTSEAIGAIANPIRFASATKTAPLRIKARKNLIDAVLSGGAYGIGISEGDYKDYAKNISSSIIGNVAGYGLSNRNFGRAGSPLGRKGVNEFTNWGTKKLINLLEDKD